MKSLGQAVKGYGQSLSGKFSNEPINLLEESHWTITTYETLRDREHIFRAIEWGVIIFDEAQKIKNPNSLLSEMAKAMKSDFSIAVTGTPIENSLIDLWCIADCVFPKKFGVLKDFKQKYCKSNSDLRPLKEMALKEEPPFMIKRWKSNVVKTLPSKKIKKYRDRLSQEQVRAYDAIIEKTQNRNYTNPLEALQELKRYTLYIDENVDDTDLKKQNIRIHRTCEILSEIKKKDEKAIIFLNSLILQNRLASFFKNEFKMENPPLIINGKLSGEKRKNIVDDFQKKRWV